MFPKEITFELEQRRYDWALLVRLDNADGWVITAWEKKPTQSELESVAIIITRSMEVYHRHLRIPGFKVMPIKIKEI